MSRLRACRDGRTNDRRFTRRHVGQGERAGQIAALFDVMRRRHGLGDRIFRPDESHFRRPASGGPEQLELFADLD